MTNYKTLETAIITEINNLRQKPQSYLTNIKTAKTYYKSKEYHNPTSSFNILTEEGTLPIPSLLKLLKTQKKLKPLKKNETLKKIGETLLKKIGPLGKTASADKNLRLNIRTKSHFEKEGQIAENISFGCNSAKEVVVQMLIDDGVENRGHRLNLLNSGFREIGVCCVDHEVYGVCCSVVFFGKGELAESVFERFEIGQGKWPKGCLSLRKFVEVQSVQGVRYVRVKYVFRMEEGEDVVLEEDFVDES